MAGRKKEPTITELIDQDEGLKSKRKLLTITSLILLALTFSGAKVEEANTFILKLKFDNQSGIPILLVLVIVFLLIRYYNYAKPYHEKLFREWSDRMLDDKYFSWAEYHTNELHGLVSDMAPKGLDIVAMQHEGKSFNYHYKCDYFRRKLVYSWDSQYDYEREEVKICLENYFNVYRLEAKYQIESFFNHRENLDVLASYGLGFLAIFSYFFNDYLQIILNALAVK